LPKAGTPLTFAEGSKLFWDNSAKTKSTSAGGLMGELDHLFGDPCPDVRSTDVYREDGIVPLKHPRRNEIDCADETCLVRIVADDANFDFHLVDLEQHGSAADRKLADAARSG
jgi:hypothetical protein